MRYWNRYQQKHTQHTHTHTVWAMNLTFCQQQQHETYLRQGDDFDAVKHKYDESPAVESFPPKRNRLLIIFKLQRAARLDL